MPIIVTSSASLAGKNLLEQFLAFYSFEKTGELFEDSPIYDYKGQGKLKLITTRRKIIAADHLNEFSTDLFIFASKHESAAKIPALLTHSTGNWTSEAKFGGLPNELGIAPAFAIKEALLELHNQKTRLDLEQYNVSLEVSHHGPTNLNAPIVFIEVGSTPDQWSDKKAVEAVVNVAMHVASTKKRYKAVIGVGGGHYAPEFNHLLLKTEYAISHIVPKYVLETINENMIKKAIDRSFEKIELCVLDWKGMKSHHRDTLLQILEGLQLPYIKVRKLLRA
ncbi:MAG: D-aminoacyl-tRNA deacylase [Promethearchaeota archaeon]